MRHLEINWQPYQQSIAEGRPFNWQEDTFLVGTAIDFTDSWFDVQFVYISFNIKDNHWVLLRFEPAECELKYWDSLPEVTPLEEVKKRLVPISKLLDRLLDSVGYYGETR